MRFSYGFKHCPDFAPGIITACCFPSLRVHFEEPADMFRLPPPRRCLIPAIDRCFYPLCSANTARDVAVLAR